MDNIAYPHANCFLGIQYHKKQKSEEKNKEIMHALFGFIS